MGSSILAALGGLSEGFSKDYSKIQDENRKQAFESSKLIAESLKQRADTDETLTPEEHDNLYRQYYKTLHPELKPKDLETLVGTHSYIRSQMAGAMPKPPENAPTGLGGPEDAGISGGLPAMPSAPMTMGQAKFNEAQPRTVQGEKDKAAAQRDAIANEKRAELETHLQLIKENKDNPDALRFLNASAKSGGNLTIKSQTMTGAELKRSTGWATLPNGGPIEEQKDYHPAVVGSAITDAFEAEPQIGTKQAIVDPNDPSKIVVNLYDKQGRLMKQIPGAVYGGFGTTTRNGIREGAIQYTDPVTGVLKTEVIPFASATSTTRTPAGMTPPGGAQVAPSIPSPPGVEPPKPTPGTPKPKLQGGSTGRQFISPAQGKMEAENPLTGEGQKAMTETTPVLNQIHRAMVLLDPVKTTNQPLEYAIQRLGYSIGMSTEASQLINNLEIGKVIGAARLLKGSSRAVQALEMAMVHLPDPKKDSPKLMYEKLQNIEQNLRDIQSSAQQFEVKRPGLTRVGPTGKTNTPSTPLPTAPGSAISRDELDKLLHGVK